MNIIYPTNVYECLVSSCQQHRHIDRWTAISSRVEWKIEQIYVFLDDLKIEVWASLCHETVEFVKLK